MAETILQKIVERGHYKFVDSVETWQEAVKLSTDTLVATGYCTADYYQQINDCVEKYGPYVVFDHYVAMPHSQEGAGGVLKTSVGFMRVKDVVDFGEDEDGEKKEAKLFFTLASCDPNEHLDNIQQLMGIFTNEDLLDALMEAETPEDILKAEQDFPCEEF
ncbi:MAG: PTS sugar transporter subunit IIA [Oscillospiraceae bacterium]|nr:PTS sugar transporter subunit IIA [Oscillospiraceae bacterium]MCQ2448467.1 PTS sugar transporter subunit IIA [Oscillibacter sp.]